MHMISSENIRRAEIFDSLIFKWLKIQKKKWKQNKHVQGKLKRDVSELRSWPRPRPPKASIAQPEWRLPFLNGRPTMIVNHRNLVCWWKTTNIFWVRRKISRLLNVGAENWMCRSVWTSETERNQVNEFISNEISFNVVIVKRWTVNAHSKCPTIVLQLNLNLTKQAIEWIFEIIPLLWILIGKNVIWLVGK